DPRRAIGNAKHRRLSVYRPASDCPSWEERRCGGAVARSERISGFPTLPDRTARTEKFLTGLGVRAPHPRASEELPEIPGKDRYQDRRLPLLEVAPAKIPKAASLIKDVCYAKCALFRSGRPERSDTGTSSQDLGRVAFTAKLHSDHSRGRI